MATSRHTNPRRLDVAAFAEHGEALHGEWPLTDMERLAELERGALGGAAERSGPGAAPAAGDAASGGVHWTLHGESRARHGAEPEVWLHIEARTVVAMECQRCLQPVPVALAVDRWLRFVPGGEEAAAAIDADSEDDVLPLQRAVDVQTLVEDELLLALPLVAHHEVCPQPLPMSFGDEPAEAAPADDDAAPERPHPFAVLAQLKDPGRRH